MAFYYGAVIERRILVGSLKMLIRLTLAIRTAVPADVEVLFNLLRALQALPHKL
jgi:hypothetical protein